MYIKRLSVENYRNLENAVFLPSEKINVIYGNNAQGKTNLLEALWLLTGGRSFRGAKDSELIRFGNTYTKVKAEFYSEAREQTLEIHIKDGKRRAILNDVPKNYLSQIIGSVCAVVFSPNHLTLVKNGPEERRNFMDAALCQIKPSYAVVLSKYKKILNQRNALLKEMIVHRELEETLDIWNEQLCREGALIESTRDIYIQELNQKAEEFYSGISSGTENLKITYQISGGGSSGMTEEELQKQLLVSLARKKKDDLSLGFTSTGPHRDDIQIQINGREAKKFGSQGQQRSCVLAMKLAEAAILSEKKKESPVILLDDVLSELDSARKEYLLQKLKNMQVFITCCEENIQCENLVLIQNGRFIPKNH